eukprot:TRINITY_DN49812_c0_g1_i2.p2 TRINITY_DN49812_c0_g1~~TRINITY_DN49812_c0_g1_i2.p2  ORF type:complete len:110 (-),score=25.54 TRINITY_DN49812_c0_g1_i2:10-339(-)
MEHANPLVVPEFPETMQQIACHALAMGCLIAARSASLAELGDGDGAVDPFGLELDPVACLHPVEHGGIGDAEHHGHGIHVEVLDGRMLEKIGRAVQQECRDRSRMPSSA